MVDALSTVKMMSSTGGDRGICRAFIDERIGWLKYLHPGFGNNP